LEWCRTQAHYKCKTNVIDCYRVTR
jgi:Domain of unknown function (DUF6989)